MKQLLARTLSWIRERIPGILDELLAALVLAILGYSVFYFRNSIAPLLDRAYHAFLQTDARLLIFAIFLLTAFFAVLFIWRWRAISNWSLSSIQHDSDFETFMSEVCSILQIMGFSLESKKERGIDILGTRKLDEISHRIAVFLEPNDSLILRKANVKSLIRLLKQEKIDEGYYISRNPRSYFKGRKICEISKNFLKFLSYNEFGLKSINFEPYLRYLILNWKTSRLVTEYIRVIGLDENGEMHSPLENYIDNIFNHSRSGSGIILLGDFGSGKTTFLRYYAHILAERHLKDPISNRFPVFADLKNYKTVGSLEQLISRELVRHGVTTELNITEDVLLRRKLVLILDAFDEMSLTVDRFEVQRNLQQIKNILSTPGAVIVSCRTHFFRDKVEESQLEALAPVHVQNWNKNQIIEYLKKMAGPDWRKALKFIRKTYNLQQLAQTPLFLRMIVRSLDKLSQQSVRSVELYTVYTNEWINSQVYKAVLDRDQKTEIMEDLAWKMVCEGRPYISWTELRNLIQRRYGLSVTEIDRFDNDIRTCSFLHRPPESTVYAFIHSSFMEFFVAQRLAKLVKENNIKDLCKVELTHDIMNFMAQSLDELTYYERLHLWLEFKDNPEFALARRNVAHILRIISRSPLSPSVDKSHLKGTAELATLALTGSSPEIRCKAIISLGWQRPNDVTKVLHKVLAGTEDDARVLRISVLVLGLLEDRSAIQIISTKLREAKDFIVRQNCAVALGYMADTNAVSNMIYCLKHEKDYRVRRSLIWALESTNLNMAFETLVDRVIHDPNEEVRQYAALAFARLGKSEALEVLEEVLRDTIPRVRRSALESIGRIGGERALQIARGAMNDPDPGVREASQYAINLITSNKIA